jgi:putative ABC transport system substrate-binding protein
MRAPAPATPPPHRAVRIGVVGRGPEHPRQVVLEEALRQRGWVKGDNLAVEYRDDGVSTTSEPHAILAAELVRLGVDLIVAWAGPAALGAQRATSTVAIVFTSVGDPVGIGLVASWRDQAAISRV